MTDKPDLRAIRGGKPTKTSDIPKELQKYMEIVAQQCMMFLSTCYPEVAATDPERIRNAALAAARDIHALQPMMAVFTPEGRRRFVKMRFALTRPSPIHGAPDPVGIGFEPPVDLSLCTETDQTMQCLTTHAYLLSDVARALLYFHGYQLTFGLYERAPDPATDTTSEPA
jgi:hypothetical protein